jgi:hypothetical protein
MSMTETQKRVNLVKGVGVIKSASQFLATSPQ